MAEKSVRRRTTPEERALLRERRVRRRKRKKIFRIACALLVCALVVLMAQINTHSANTAASIASAKSSSMQDKSTVVESTIPGGFTQETYNDYCKAQAVKRTSDILASTKLIAHATGAYHEGDRTTAYTNTQASLDQNYDLGQRAFEVDFQLTSDGELACTHDWNRYNNKIPSAAQWNNETITTSGGSKLHSMMAKDLVNEMASKPDMVLFTDTKAAAYSKEDKHLIYSRLVQAFAEKDSDLLLNVVPYVYSLEDYEAAMEAYDWPYVVYAAYANSDTSEQIDDFIHKHDNAKAICVDKNDPRLTDALIKDCHEHGVEILTYTTNEAAEAKKLLERGVDAIITDTVLPKEL